MNVNNTASAPLLHVLVHDLLPAGLTYHSSSSGSSQSGQNVDWSDIGPMAPGSMKTIWIKATIDGTFYGTLTNKVDAEGKPEYGDNVTDHAEASVEASKSGIDVKKTASPTFGSMGTLINFTMDVTNNGASPLVHVYVEDTLPDGLTYHSSSAVSSNSGKKVYWSDIGSLAIGENKQVWLKATIDGSVYGTLTNQVDVVGKPEYGDNVTANATADVQAQTVGIDIEKEADPSVASKGATVDFPIKITNTDDMKLAHVKAVDVLPLGMDYISSGTSPAPDSADPVDGRWTLTWNDLGPLNKDDYHRLNVRAKINVSGPATLTNEANTVGTPVYGAEVYDNDTANVTVESAEINVNKTASPLQGVPGEKITFTIVIKNTGSATLCQVNCQDTIPDGLLYLRDDHNGTLAAPNKVVWSDLGCLDSGESITIIVETEIVGTIIGVLNNVVDVEGTPYCSRLSIKQIDPSMFCCGDPVTDRAEATVDVEPVPYIISKTSDKSSYRPGEEMTYTIKVCNVMDYVNLEEVVVKDVFQDKKVQIIASYPESVDGQWYYSSIKPHECITITLVAVYPASNMTFDLGESSVAGSGFVNVHNDLSTGISPFPVKNCVYVTAKIYDTNDRSKYTSWDREKCYAVTIQDIGTELQTREHGSGDYETEETTKLIMRNRSIESSKSVSASYRPTVFELPSGNGINYTSMWTEESRGINHITGASMHEAYRYATDIDRDTYIKMDENGSEMKIDSSFEGLGSIGFLKRASFDSGPKVKPAFEDVQRYNGRFQLNQSFEEYGDNARTVTYSSGEGFASTDRRIGDSQRSYEYGTGTYQSEQLVDTFSSYVSKDIEVAHKPSSFNYSPSLNAKQDLKWSEGMWSKKGKLAGGDILATNASSCAPVKKQTDASCQVNSSVAPATLISEEYTSLQYLKKSSVALGLNEMKSNATFSGMADYKAKTAGINGKDEVDSEERYVGDYDISRHVLITGVSKYDTPHMTVTKVGELKNEWVNRVNGTVAEYVITVTNDGSKSLAPIYVTDRLPSGTEYVSSSYKPTSVSATAANWTILHLGIGNSLTISLKLNVTEEAAGNIVNRVSVSGISGDSIVTASNYTTLVSDMLPCCTSKVLLDKKGEVNSQDPTLVNYTIFLRNDGYRVMAIKLTDELPAGMKLLGATLEPESYESGYIHWVLTSLKPSEEASIMYSARAPSNGAYTNRVHLDATAVDGSGEETADASAFVDVRGTAVAPTTFRYDGWQPPDWDFNTSDQGLTI
jgi:large repetitive protein